MKFPFATVASTLVSAVLLLNCSGESSSPPEPEPPRPLQAGEMKLVEYSESFGLNRFGQLISTSSDPNVIVSPLSVSMALGMAYVGAEGSTREAMEMVLELYGLQEQEVYESYESLIGLLTHLDAEVQVDIANSIWYREGLEVKPEFLDINRDYLEAEVTGLDFDSPTAVPTINNWVNTRTNGKIPTIVGPTIDPLTRLFLINAVYFKGAWTTSFDETVTMAPFQTLDGPSVQVPMMQLETELLYLENDLFQAVDLPYGNGWYSMTVLLPQSGLPVDSLIGMLNAADWNQWISSMQEMPGHVFMPRYTVRYETSLLDVLAALGMGVAFESSTADFTGIAEAEDLYISEILHKTFVAVDEEGTEAAAATSVTIGVTSVNPSEKFTIRLDRPFLFAIRDSHSGALAFIGRVGDPTTSE